MAHRPKLNTDVYERFVEKIKLLNDVHTAIREIEQGAGVPDQTAKAELRNRFTRR